MSGGGAHGARSRLFCAKKCGNIIKCQQIIPQKGDHPTQKPLKIIKELLECVTNPGDIVLDPFVGSGTTCIASAQLNRKSIGIDLDKTYCEISKLRLNNLEEIV